MGIKAGGFEFGCVGCCLPVSTSAMSRKVLFVRWPPDFSITYHRSAGKIDVNRILFFMYFHNICVLLLFLFWGILILFSKYFYCICKYEYFTKFRNRLNSY